MNWGRVFLAGLAGGIVIFFADFLMHGIILGQTYRNYPEVFAQEGASPLWFLAVSVCIGLVAAAFYGRTYDAWGGGAANGARYGIWIGLLGFFFNFYNPLVIEGFPYFLSWCWGGIGIIDGLLLGAVVGALYRKA